MSVEGVLSYLEPLESRTRGVAVLDALAALDADHEQAGALSLESKRDGH